MRIVSGKTVALHYGLRVLAILQEIRDGFHPGISLTGPFVAVPLAGKTGCRGSYDPTLDVEEIKKVGLCEAKFEIVAPGIFRDVLTGDFVDIGARNESPLPLGGMGDGD